MTPDQVSTLENGLLDAQWLSHTETSDKNVAAEEKAYNRYSDACDEIHQCREIGCRAEVTDYAYCSNHRD